MTMPLMNTALPVMGRIEELPAWLFKEGGNSGRAICVLGLGFFTSYSGAD